MAKKKKAAAKKKKQEDLGRSKTLGVSLYEKEIDLIREYCTTHDRDISEWCRQVLLAKIGVKARPRKRGRPRKVRV